MRSNCRKAKAAVWTVGRVWLIAFALKAKVPERVPWVQILHRPSCKTKVEAKVLKKVWKYITSSGEHHSRSLYDRLKNA